MKPLIFVRYSSSSCTMNFILFPLRFFSPSVLGLVPLHQLPVRGLRRHLFVIYALITERRDVLDVLHTALSLAHISCARPGFLLRSDRSADCPFLLITTSGTLVSPVN